MTRNPRQDWGKNCGWIFSSSRLAVRGLIDTSNRGRQEPSRHPRHVPPQQQPNSPSHAALQIKTTSWQRFNSIQGFRVNFQIHGNSWKSVSASHSIPSNLKLKYDIGLIIFGIYWQPFNQLTQDIQISWWQVGKFCFRCSLFRFD